MLRPAPASLEFTSNKLFSHHLKKREKEIAGIGKVIETEGRLDFRGRVGAEGRSCFRGTKCLFGRVKKFGTT